VDAGRGGAGEVLRLGAHRRRALSVAVDEAQPAVISPARDAVVRV
jgi:hypothetical protein